MGALDPAQLEPRWLEVLSRWSVVGGILFAGVMLTVLIVSLAFASATRFWPRRLLAWSVLLSTTVIVSGILAGVVQIKLRFPTEPFPYDAVVLLLGSAWNIPLVILIGEPVLAALLGHWLYLAAKSWSAPTGQPFEPPPPDSH